MQTNTYRDTSTTKLQCLYGPALACGCAYSDFDCICRAFSEIANNADIKTCITACPHNEDGHCGLLLFLFKVVTPFIKLIFHHFRGTGPYPRLLSTSDRRRYPAARLHEPVCWRTSTTGNIRCRFSRRHDQSK